MQDRRHAERAGSETVTSSRKRPLLGLALLALAGAAVFGVYRHHGWHGASLRS